MVKLLRLMEMILRSNVPQGRRYVGYTLNNSDIC